MKSAAALFCPTLRRFASPLPKPFLPDSPWNPKKPIPVEARTISHLHNSSLSTLVKSLVFFAIPCFGRKQLTRVELSAEPHTDMDAQKAYERRMAELHGPEEEQTMPCASQASDQDLTETHLDTGKTTTLCVTSSRNLATSTKNHSYSSAKSLSQQGTFCYRAIHCQHLPC